MSCFTFVSAESFISPHYFLLFLCYHISKDCQPFSLYVVILQRNASSRLLLPVLHTFKALLCVCAMNYQILTCIIYFEVIGELFSLEIIWLCFISVFYFSVVFFMEKLRMSLLYFPHTLSCICRWSMGNLLEFFSAYIWIEGVRVRLCSLSPVVVNRRVMYGFICSSCWYFWEVAVVGEILSQATAIVFQTWKSR